ncbi:major capsid protein [Piscirickettsia litoralis]|uniref:Major capsid protein E n=1 Tax=Piscirickettsia litoralis TaxID=1891921 RepID=A0ABX2ZY78_9GAMM|nr:major capsid protein [Piscirickettsia litoralis]ODN41562.1 hypothetical protein BGC07_15755 [Piscirickettsia litoralis]
MSIDPYETRTLLGVLEQVKPIQRFFLNTFFKEENTFDTLHVDVDIVKGSRRVAPFVSPLLEGKVVKNEGFVTETFKPGYIKVKNVITPMNVFKRKAGQTIYTKPKSPALLAAEHVGKTLSKLTEMADRREELMAASAILNGGVEIKGDGLDRYVDFQMSPNHKVLLAGDALWTSANSNPMKQLDAWCRLVLQDSGHRPSYCVMGIDAVYAFLDHPKVKEHLELRRNYTIEVRPKDLPQGVVLEAYIEKLKLNIVSYNEWYLNEDTGLEESIVPANRIALCSETARCSKNYGAIEDFDVTYGVKHFAKTWKQKDPSALFLLLQAAPLPVPHEIDAFLNAVVI